MVLDESDESLASHSASAEVILFQAWVAMGFTVWGETMSLELQMARKVVDRYWDRERSPLDGESWNGTWDEFMRSDRSSTSDRAIRSRSSGRDA